MRNTSESDERHLERLNRRALLLEYGTIAWNVGEALFPHSRLSLLPLLLILTHLAFEEEEARQHWAAILEHHRGLSEALGRDAGVRVAVLDYFMNVNRKLIRPTLIDLEMLDSAGEQANEDPPP